MTRIVGWQHRDGIDIQANQIADRILIFGAVEPVERFGSTGIRGDARPSMVG
jgi:hypothetical protein